MSVDKRAEYQRAEYQRRMREALIAGGRTPSPLTLPLIDRETTPEDYEAERDQPRPGVWAGEADADLRALTQDETDLLIRFELWWSATWGVQGNDPAATADEVAQLLQALGFPAGTVPRGVLLGQHVAYRQRGGIDSDPLVRILARRAWGDRDRQWFELRGVREGDEVFGLFDHSTGQTTIAVRWNAIGRAMGVALADGRPGDTVEVRRLERYTFGGAPVAGVTKHIVSDRLREPPVQHRQIAHHPLYDRQDVRVRLDLDRCEIWRDEPRRATVIAAERDGREAQVAIPDSAVVAAASWGDALDAACERLSAQLGPRVRDYREPHGWTRGAIVIVDDPVTRPLSVDPEAARAWLAALPRGVREAPVWGEEFPVTLTEIIGRHDPEGFVTSHGYRLGDLVSSGGREYVVTDVDHNRLTYRVKPRTRTAAPKPQPPVPRWAKKRRERPRRGGR